MAVEGNTLLVSEVTCVSPLGWKVLCSCRFHQAAHLSLATVWGLVTHNVHIHFEIFMAPNSHINGREGRFAAPIRGGDFEPWTGLSFPVVC